MKLQGKTTEELLAIRKALEDDPANQTTGSLWRYTAKARKKFDEIDRQITSNLRADRIARGLPVNDCGYSGRQTNKR